MPNEVYDFIIIGSGLTGLNLGYELTLSDHHLCILILEKSKSCGGRMATRRIDDTKFDHGAQFIKKSALSEKLVKLWQEHKVLRDFPIRSLNAVCGVSGITQLAKKVSEFLNVAYNYKVQKLEKLDGVWNIHSENHQIMRAKNLVLTCPLPQSLEILKNSNIHFDSNLSSIEYSNALVFLIQSSLDSKSIISYQEQMNEEVFSVCSQLAKGNSTKPAWTIVMTDNWSKKHFDLLDEEILKEGQNAIAKKCNFLDIQSIALKKWRFCQPKEVWKFPFENPLPGLYIAGDAFGGPSLLGALKSSSDLFSYLKNGGPDRG